MDTAEERSDELAAELREIESLLRQVLVEMQEHNRLLREEGQRSWSWSSTPPTLRVDVVRPKRDPCSAIHRYVTCSVSHTRSIGVSGATTR